MLAVCGISSSVLAWGGKGHRIVAAIAYQLLPPQKATALDALLRANLGVNFIDAASYADDFIRSHDAPHHFSPWHYLDWPDSSPNPATASCTPDCILNELPAQLRGFRQAAATPQQRALALSWVIHLVGDLHQPL